jgi:hypothetical protein
MFAVTYLLPEELFCLMDILTRLENNNRRLSAFCINISRPGFGRTRLTRLRVSDTIRLDPPIHWLIKSHTRHVRAGERVKDDSAVAV